MNKGSKKTLTKLIIAVPLMFAFGFALVPLYDVFCEVTGLNGKVFQSEHTESLVIDDGRSISLQFISTNNENMPWTFQPSKEVMKIESNCDIWNLNFQNAAFKMMPNKIVKELNS